MMNSELMIIAGDAATVDASEKASGVPSRDVQDYAADPTSTEVLAKRDESVFAPQKLPPRVLAEDDYMHCVSKIIEREYFPDLLKLRLMKEMMDAEVSGNTALFESTRRRLRNAYTPMTPRSEASVAGDDGPEQVEGEEGSSAGMRRRGGRKRGREVDVGDETSSVGGSSYIATSSAFGSTRGITQKQLTDGRKVPVNLDVSLDSFQAMYTSEDTYSFYDIVAREKLKKISKNRLLGEMVGRHSVKRNLFAISSSSSNSRKALENPLQMAQVGTLAAICPHEEALPPGAEERLEHRRKVTLAANTRMSRTTDAVPEDEYRQSILAKKKQKGKESELLKAMLLKGRVGGGRGFGSNILQSPGSTPRVGGYDMLPTPMIAPEQGGLSPFMTWGEVCGTPLLNHADEELTMDSRYAIPAMPQRDKAASLLAERAALKLKGRKMQRFARDEKLMQHSGGVSSAMMKKASNLISASPGLLTRSPSTTGLIGRK
eukprot:GHVU01096617.1.p1 GENE.GHVU01096617.1~~GHVU01096617.1.p1  ORF type:complete len:488 (-),score=82.01 GHVU01096617.1:2923-4386(-)